MKKWILFFLLAFLIMGPAVSAQDEAESAWWADRVFYQIFVRSFYDSDGDGIGDFQGIIEKLDYLNDGDPATTDDLGVTALWLMPIHPSPSYHGYDVTDYYDVNPDYGTMDDFLDLVDEAHARGIAVIIDFVMNHTSSQHPWFIDSKTGEGKYSDWYIWEKTNPGYAGPWGAQAWYQSGDRYYYGIFWSEMPDLNLANPDVSTEIQRAARFWLDQVGVDGFRLDAAKHFVEEGRAQENTAANRAWLADFNSYITTVKPESFTVGEFFNTPGFRIVPYIEDGAVDMGFEFDLAEAIVSSAFAGNKRNLSRAHENVLEDYPPGQFAIFLANHDQPRLMTTIRGRVGVNKVAASLLLLNAGVPFLYYGEEIGMEGPKPDELIRRPMQWDESANAGFTNAEPWQALPEDFAKATVSGQNDDPDSLLSHYRNLVHLRNARPTLQTGETIIVETDNRAVYAFLRMNEEEKLLVVVNLDDAPVAEYTLTLENSPLEGITQGELLMGEGEIALPEVNASGGFDAYTPLSELGAYSTFVIRLQ